MQRYALKIEYHGAPFVGWQRQIDLASVQGAIEDALAKIEPRAHNIAAAGRTDAGVHALAQVAHCDMERDWTPFRLSEAINYHLKPLPIAIVDCVAVDDDFHARFSALERRYLFRVLVRRPPATHQAGLVWQVKKPLDIDRMREAATHLIGEHDFTTFRSSECQAKSPMRTLDAFEVAEAFEVPLAIVLDPANFNRQSRMWRGARRTFYVLPFEDRLIWGATAGMLVNLSRRLAEKGRC
mgnify:CR=1 FL=1